MFSSSRNAEVDARGPLLKSFVYPSADKNRLCVQFLDLLKDIGFSKPLLDLLYLPGQFFMRNECLFRGLLIRKHDGRKQFEIGRLLTAEFVQGPFDFILVTLMLVSSQ